MVWSRTTSRWWLLAIAAALAATLGARLFTRASQHALLLVDSIAMVGGAAIVIAAERRSTTLSARARRWHWVLATGFVLGAIRAVLRRQGLDVHRANVVVLGLGIVVAAAFALRSFRRRRGIR